MLMSLFITCFMVFMDTVLIYVTVQVKTSLVHTSDFPKLMVHKILLECHRELKFSVMIK